MKPMYRLMNDNEEVENCESPSLAKIRETAKKYKAANGSTKLYIEKLTFVDDDLDDVIFVESVL
jgi:hypothetical protein